MDKANEWKYRLQTLKMAYMVKCLIGQCATISSSTMIHSYNMIKTSKNYFILTVLYYQICDFWKSMSQCLGFQDAVSEQGNKISTIISPLFMKWSCVMDERCIVNIQGLHWNETGEARRARLAWYYWVKPFCSSRSCSLIFIYIYTLLSIDSSQTNDLTWVFYW